jgi:hypothetical protein
MTGRTNVQALMQAIGPQLALLEVTEFAALNTWSLVVDEATVLFADYDEGREVLVLSAEAGRPAETDRLQLYDLLLRYNIRWAETGGVRMALDGEAGSVTQLFELAVNGLDLPRLQTVVARFLDTLRAWREIVGQAPAAAETPFATMPCGMIRA